MIPKVRGDTLVYYQDGHEQTLTVGTAARYAWLETASTFAFVNDMGTFTARREQAGHKRGGWYWKAYRKHQGKLSSRYLGKSEALAPARLQAVAQALATVPAETPAPKAREAMVPVAAPAAHEMPHDPLISLLSTKLHMPRLRGPLVSRPHLLDRLQHGMASVLTLVSAPAGFGKTTLLAQWLTQSSMLVAWLSLEPQDNEATRFLSYAIAALQTLDPHLGTTSLLPSPFIARCSFCLSMAPLSCTW
jgi:LuxR family maltose regulon positive regulatory protein